MNNVIISTKSTTAARRNVGIITAALVAVMGIFVLAFYSYATERTSDDSLIFLLLLALFLIGDGIIMIAINCINGSTYVDICSDRFVGKGIQGLSALSFNIKLEEINNVSVEGFWIHIHTSSGAYKVMTDKDTAAKVYDYYIGLKG